MHVTHVRGTLGATDWEGGPGVKPGAGGPVCGPGAGVGFCRRSAGQATAGGCLEMGGPAGRAPPGAWEVLQVRQTG